ncbi:DUF5082 family protein [Lactobacillus rodentium]|uniref:Uncharacterized protein n=1 Tax=Lactobacillus rodentium TaxID=947835 RepID=A0A2Z6TRY1_9LACO|nr:DUF5082 family protein [Lactobacillus rodentium]MCR1894182.1 DUF5082 family protein [Lactobacillus rodentium]GBG04479.1 hypothetical protein LrDSM24759_03930 [Lactobacillus rodentium]
MSKSEITNMISGLESQISSLNTKNKDIDNKIAKLNKVKRNLAHVSDHLSKSHSKFEKISNSKKEDFCGQQRDKVNQKISDVMSEINALKVDILEKAGAIEMKIVQLRAEQVWNNTIIGGILTDISSLKGSLALLKK